MSGDILVVHDRAITNASWDAMVSDLYLSLYYPLSVWLRAYS